MADPFLKLRLGSQVIDDSKNVVRDTLNPDFYRMFEFATELPGESSLKVCAHPLVRLWLVPLHPARGYRRLKHGTGMNSLVMN